MPHFSSVPGRKFSMTMSASRASRRTISWPSSLRRSMVIDFLLRACTYHQSDVPLCSRRHWRSGSPPGLPSEAGGSIFMTSAPNSAKTLPANGPAMSWPSSRTLRPASGRGGASLDSMRGFQETARRNCRRSRLTDSTNIGGAPIPLLSNGVTGAPGSQRAFELWQLRRHVVADKNLRLGWRADLFLDFALGDALARQLERL